MTPPFEITPKILNLVSDISLNLGKLEIKKDLKLRKVSKIKTISSTLLIENISANEEKVTAILENKRVLATKKELGEIKGAIRLYENIDKINYKSQKDLLKAHKILMNSILERAGEYRSSNVGVGNISQITHIAPPSQRVPILMNELFEWLNKTNHHPLIVSSVFHYEFEFIHPFVDGNGRMGRFWQTLILYSWNSLFEYLPIESLIYENQELYYQSIEESNSLGNSTPFIEFMLKIILDTITTQANTQATTQDKKELITEYCKTPKSLQEIKEYLKLKNRKYVKSLINELTKENKLSMTIPDKPTSPKQKYIVCPEKCLTSVTLS